MAEAHVALVISGPIASGKSTVSRALAGRVEQQNSTAAVIDLDLLYEMLAPGGGPKNDHAKWRSARRAAGTLAANLAADGIGTVVVDGDFLKPADREALREGAGANVDLRFVTLHVDFDEARQRVKRDETRTASRDLVFLRKHYAAATAIGANHGDLVLDTRSLSVDEAVARILDFASLS
jgi:adenylylsulfate kinase-like enzyme